MTGASAELPKAARDRLARFDPAGVRTSLLPVAGAVGLDSVGLTPVGDVMGGIAQYFGWVGGANYLAGPLAVGPVSYQPYVDAVYHGYRTALDRMITEATAIGADGVVGVRLNRDRRGDNTQEFTALGTAVRANSAHRPHAVFTTDLPGQDVAKLMHAGWVPVRLCLGIAVHARFLDFVSAQQMSLMAGNTEVDGFTELINAVRAQARSDFAAHAAATGADGAIVAAMGQRAWHEEVGNNALLCAESSVVGSTVARFHHGARAPSRSLTVMPLRQPPPARWEHR